MGSQYSRAADRSEPDLTHHERCHLRTRPRRGTFVVKNRIEQRCSPRTLVSSLESVEGRSLTWQPLSVRDGRVKNEGPYEDVPEHLFEPLRHWVETSFTGEPGYMDATWGGPRLAAAVRFPIRPRPGQPLTVQEVTQALVRAPVVMLDVVDAVLHLYASFPNLGSLSPFLDDSFLWSSRCRDLDELLKLAGSVWRVGPNRDCLVRSVDPTATAAFVHASSPSDVASDELKEAWSAAYGRNADPSDAWDHSIKAVEGILIPIVTPNKAKATLADVVGSLNSQGHLWKLEMHGHDGTQSVAPLASMLRLMWPNPDRHGSAGSRKPLLVEAQAVVHLAVTIVQWARSDVLSKRQLGPLRRLVFLHHRGRDAPRDPAKSFMRSEAALACVAGRGRGGGWRRRC